MLKLLNREIINSSKVIQHFKRLKNDNIIIMPADFNMTEHSREKTNNLHMRKQRPQISFAVTAKLISAFVFATQIVQSFFLNPKFQASSHLLSLHSSVCVRPDRNPYCYFSHV